MLWRCTGQARGYNYRGHCGMPPRPWFAASAMHLNILMNVIEGALTLMRNLCLRLLLVCNMYM